MFVKQDLNSPTILLRVDRSKAAFLSQHLFVSFVLFSIECFSIISLSSLIVACPVYPPIYFICF